jgi:serine phosphatase RsbU (regulator of sigma subunit)
MEYLEITNAQGKRWRVELNRDRLLIGRESTCDVQLPHLDVARHHAQLQRSPQGQWLLQDLNSLNQVYVNDRPVQQITLEQGQEFRISEFRLTIIEASTVPKAVPARPIDTGEPWTGLDPGWLGQLHSFQVGFLRLDGTRQVLEQLAREVCRIAQPQSVAVGTGGPEGYKWQVVVSQSESGSVAGLKEADERVGSDESGVKVWTYATQTGETQTGETPERGPPLGLLFPIQGRSGIIGHLFVDRPRYAPLSPDVERYITLLVMHAGLVWDNLLLAELRSQRKGRQRELSLARKNQTELLPRRIQVHPALNAFAVNLPSVHVSGDSYDLVRTGPDTVAFVIADAMGHGMPAALMMASVRAAMRMGLTLNQPWGKMFEVLDKIVTQEQAGAFVTGLVGQIDLAKRELEIVSAGHPLPSILLNGKPATLPEECQTRPWGLDFPAPWQVGRLSLGPSDWSILCYTEGITDSKSRTQRSLNTADVMSFHQRNPHKSAEELCEGLISDAASRQEAGSLADDQTVLVLRSTESQVPNITAEQRWVETRNQLLRLRDEHREYWGAAENIVIARYLAGTANAEETALVEQCLRESKQLQTLVQRLRPLIERFSM